MTSWPLSWGTQWFEVFEVLNIHIGQILRKADFLILVHRSRELCKRQHRKSKICQWIQKTCVDTSCWSERSFVCFPQKVKRSCRTLTPTNGSAVPSVNVLPQTQRGERGGWGVQPCSKSSTWHVTIIHTENLERYTLGSVVWVTVGLRFIRACGWAEVRFPRQHISYSLNVELRPSRQCASAIVRLQDEEELIKTKTPSQATCNSLTPDLQANPPSSKWHAPLKTPSLAKKHQKVQFVFWSRAEVQTDWFSLDESTGIQSSLVWRCEDGLVWSDPLLRLLALHLFSRLWCSVTFHFYTSSAP